MLQLGFWNFLLPSILSNAFKKKPLGETPVWMPGILDIHIALGMKVSWDLCKEGQAAVNLRIANPYVVAVLFSLESCQLKSPNFDTNAGNCQSPCFMWRVFQLPFDVYQLPLQLTMCSEIENHLKKTTPSTGRCYVLRSLSILLRQPQKLAFWDVTSAGGLEFYACERFTQL